ncbi:unnamed protein product [Acanthoscelides obtectus]|uniref:Regulatory protein zeste n=1 Tax=Acanthoscelides obtectus TaxID=200917 RepID=A0A9P0M9G6_ACAOB|nr:unnamed protein product [Acanthoscelides obtectus]CAK1666968.1 hypothetical protein AOBTE_LOCUS25582 [Acanthoscelides obtectus]
MLIDFMEDHPQLVSQKQTNQYTSADARKLWVELSEKLNAIPGATKQCTEWGKAWYFCCNNEFTRILGSIVKTRQ